jgi:hypothetical protein
MYLKNMCIKVGHCLKSYKICQYKMLGPIKYTKINATGRYCLGLEGAVDRFLSSKFAWLVTVCCLQEKLLVYSVVCSNMFSIGFELVHWLQ